MRSPTVSITSLKSFISNQLSAADYIWRFKVLIIPSKQLIQMIIEEIQANLICNSD